MKLYWILPFLFLLGCRSTIQNEEPNKESIPTENILSEKESNKPSVLSEGWTELSDSSPGLTLDIRYATTDNFVGEQLYDCPRCFLRSDVAAALFKVSEQLAKKNLGLKLFDCYRPVPIQQKLWDKVPDARYVTPPSKGSMHNRGQAVDLTIIDSKGNELSMGTGYDYFGEKAYHTYTGHSPEIHANRTLLKSLMEDNGFRSIRTEWWHYSFTAKTHPFSSLIWECD